jgi:zinc protease
VLYDVGELHDPPGKSGLGHLVEHVYVTAATSGTPQRTINQFAKNYSKEVFGQLVFQWNAQTGSDYTVLAGVVPPDRLDEEVKQAAERMNNLQIEQSDLNREVPRVLQEIHNMFEGFPQLAARNRARERLYPRPNGGRHGGVPDQIERIALDDVRQHWRNYYKPGNARLVIAGNIDPTTLEKEVRQAFADIPAGQPIPPTPDELPPSFGRVKVKTPSVQTSSGSFVCLGYCCPPLNSNLFPAFLTLVARLQANAIKLSSDPSVFPVTFAPLDDFGTLYVIAATTKAETPDKTVERLSKFVVEAITATNVDGAAANSKEQFAFLLGTMPIPDSVLCNNVYGAAFSQARQLQLGIKGEQLGYDMDHVQQESIGQCAREYFSEANRVTVVVEP